MPVRDDLGTRMKEFYERIPKTRLIRRMPVVIRIDGKAFHTFTRGFKRPFDEVLMKTMQETTKYLCENIQGCVLGYTQSDEISLVLVDYQRFETSAWFDYEVQKMCSVAASMATMAFNKYFEICSLTERLKDDVEHDYELGKVYKNALCKGAMFDARCFNIPKEEVTNYIYWRQLDATRNSILMVGQANFSHKELQNKTCNMIQDMLHEQKGINWNDYPIVCKRGTSVIYTNYQNPQSLTDEDIIKGWKIDTEMPILKGEDRAYVDDLVYVGE